MLDPNLIRILEVLREGIHIVDRSGTTVFYNAAMESIEGLRATDVVGRNLSEMYTDWNRERSTMFAAIEEGRPIHVEEQQYVNHLGRVIHTVNTTIPLYDGEEPIGAAEISRDFTLEAALSEQILALRGNQKGRAPKDAAPVIRRYRFGDLIGRSESFSEAMRAAQRAASTASSVLICGDTGTGKELFAQSIHYASARADRPFIAQNCAAIPEGLLESILFGTVKGAFTGAENREGLFEQASGGTLFLDEINSMSTALQAKLLRVLQESYIRRVGGTEDIPVDVRIIASSNAPPQQLLDSGSLRRDLYYRINVVSILIPSLSDRREDIPLLVDFFIRDFAEKYGKNVWMLAADLMEDFKSYAWPGNVRELRNIIEASINEIGDERVIAREHLPRHFETKLRGRRRARPLSDRLDEMVARYERSLIEEYFDGNISRTARALGISRQNLQYKLRKYGIESEDRGGGPPDERGRTDRSKSAPEGVSR